MGGGLLTQKIIMTRTGLALLKKKQHTVTLTYMQVQVKSKGHHQLSFLQEPMASILPQYTPDEVPRP